MKSTLLGIWMVAAFGFGGGTAQAATFTYHGSLQDSGKSAEGSYDIELTLYSAPSGGSVIGGPLVMYKVPVHGGSFNTEADFGPLSQSFSQAFVSVRVRNAGQGDYAALTARSQVTATTTASVCPGAWTLQGNAGNPTGSYLGTADIQPLTFDVAATQVGQITPSGDSTNAPSGPNVVFGSPTNTASLTIGGATIAGGGDSATNCGGASNLPCANSVQANFATIGGGRTHIASGVNSTIAGGANNTASGFTSTVAGGGSNTASGLNSTVGGGGLNIASGASAMIPGGQRNTAGGDYSFAGGAGATVRSVDFGSFVWEDASTLSTNFTSNGPNQFLIQANGGVAINGTPIANTDELTIYGNGNVNTTVNVHLLPQGATNGFNVRSQGGSSTAPSFQITQDGASTATRFDIGSTGNIGLLGAGTVTNPLTVGTDATTGNGAFLSAGGVWTSASSRTFKEDFARIDPGSILAKVIALPVQTWFYKNDHQEGRHIGPVAEDFAALFGLGNDDKHVGGVDESGVAFAAIQGLNAKLDSTDKSTTQQVEKATQAIDALKQENAELRATLNELSTRLAKLESVEGQ